MGSMNMRSQAAATALHMQSAPRPPGETPADAISRNLLMAALGVPSLPPADRLSDARVAELLAYDPALVKEKFRSLYCVPPGPFYCEQERIEWAAANPWCVPANVPLVTVPTFTDEVTRTAWMETHRHCPVPPPVLSDHVCTPGDPECDTRVTAPAANSGLGMFLAGAAAIGVMWWLSQSDSRKNPTDANGRSVEVHVAAKKPGTDRRHVWVYYPGDSEGSSKGAKTEAEIKALVAQYKNFFRIPVNVSYG